MDVNAQNLQTLYMGYNALFQQGIAEAQPQFEQVTMIVPSATKSVEYGWLGKIPSVRKWIGPRQLNALNKYKYQIDEEPWELTVEVDRDDIETDNIGIYNPMFSEMGNSTGVHYDELAWGTLAKGFTEPCYDGQNFFDTDHPVLDKNGAEISVSNTHGSGSGPCWFVVDDTRKIKPIILQRRRDWRSLVKMDQENDPNVFMNKQFVYGTDARYNMGYGLWQYAFGSKEDLDKVALKDAFGSMEGMVGDYGRPVGGRPRKLIVPPALREEGLELVNAERNAAGATNVWRGTLTLEVVPWLTGL